MVGPHAEGARRNRHLQPLAAVGTANGAWRQVRPSPMFGEDKAIDTSCGLLAGFARRGHGAPVFKLGVVALVQQGGPPPPDARACRGARKAAGLNRPHHLLFRLLCNDAGTPAGQPAWFAHVPCLLSPEAVHRFRVQPVLAGRSAASCISLRTTLESECRQADACQQVALYSWIDVMGKSTCIRVYPACAHAATGRVLATCASAAA